MIRLTRSKECLLRLFFSCRWLIDAASSRRQRRRGIVANFRGLFFESSSLLRLNLITLAGDYLGSGRWEDFCVFILFCNSEGGDATQRKICEGEKLSLNLIKMWSKNYRSLAVKVRNGGRQIQCTMLKLGIRVDFLKVFTLQRTVVSRRLSLGLPVSFAGFLIEYFFSSCLY